ncbi:transmembrane E3 ubiquitin-protein ligase FLY1-like [Humulus lupulus]|uniref:transmembrane E3 ubiquitin-protein ligase FLY1-like n=1 Tax=Humulus lupulus TaxID=3486 RepID=UPI002B410AB3|nr:transmembrane E3 ubiquitin-protein ligase FLY1-like [Humulus lupulus]
MVAKRNLGFGCFSKRRLGLLNWVVFGFWLALLLLQPVASVRPLRERARSWGDEWLFRGKKESDLGPFSAWNIIGTYRVDQRKKLI